MLGPHPGIQVVGTESWSGPVEQGLSCWGTDAQDGAWRSPSPMLACPSPPVAPPLTPWATDLVVDVVILRPEVAVLRRQVGRSGGQLRCAASP